MRPFSASVTVTAMARRSEEHTSELQSPCNLVCRLLLEKKKKQQHRLAHPKELKHEQLQGALLHSLGDALRRIFAHRHPAPPHSGLLGSALPLADYTAHC